MKLIPKKSLGQNFLIDKDVIKKICNSGNLKKNDNGESFFNEGIYTACECDLKKQETQQFIGEINAMKAKIKKLKPQYQRYSTLFHSKAEVEGLYQTLSEYAGQNDLVITSIEKKQIKEVLKAAALAQADGKKAKKVKQTQAKSVKNIAYYLIPVDFEIDGNFIGYIKFKRALSLSQKMLNFDKESIQVVKGDSTGAIKVRGTLTIVGLPDEFF